MLNLVDQNCIKDEILAQRLELAESLMKECEVDAWIIASREYNEDPLFHALTPAHFPTARRITLLVLGFENGNYVKYCVNLPDHELEKYYNKKFIFFKVFYNIKKALVTNTNTIYPLSSQIFYLF